MTNSGRYFEPLNPIAKEQYIEKLSLLNLTGDNGPYIDKKSNNSVPCRPGCGLLCLFLLNR